MKPWCFASSSAGNCFILEFDVNGVPTRIMVECGIPPKDIWRKANENEIDLSTIQACLITHAHGDHSKAVKTIVGYDIPVFASYATLKQLNVQGVELPDLTPFRVCEGVYVLAFPVEHDCEGSVGFVIKTATECVIFVNDHKRWTCDLSNFKPDYVFIECNYFHKVVYAQIHELQKIKSRTKEEETKLAQHKRNIDSHCSLHGTIAGLKKLNLKNTKCIFLMHLSDRYANEYKMKNEVTLEFKIQTLACQKGGGIK